MSLLPAPPKKNGGDWIASIKGHILCASNCLLLAGGGGKKLLGPCQVCRHWGRGGVETVGKSWSGEGSLNTGNWSAGFFWRVQLFLVENYEVSDTLLLS